MLLFVHYVGHHLGERNLHLNIGDIQKKSAEWDTSNQESLGLVLFEYGTWILSTQLLYMVLQVLSWKQYLTMSKAKKVTVHLFPYFPAP